jgi:hypothetical protein
MRVSTLIGEYLLGGVGASSKCEGFGCGDATVEVWKY